MPRGSTRSLFVTIPFFVAATACTEPPRPVPDGVYRGELWGGYERAGSEVSRFVDATGRVLEIPDERRADLRIATTPSGRTISLTIAPVDGGSGATCTIPWAPVRRMALTPAATCVLDGVTVSLTEIAIEPVTLDLGSDGQKQGAILDAHGRSSIGAFFVSGIFEMQEAAPRDGR